MRRFYSNGLAALVSTALIACGGGDAGEEGAQPGAAPAPAPAPAAAPAAAPSGTLSMPTWMRMDQNARTVTIDVVAGQTDANNRWNFNGFYNGDATIVVPAGYTVTMNFRNDDPANYHSAAVLQKAASWPITFTDPQPVFQGAMTSNPTSMTESTPSGGSETITFTAATAGDYALVCLIPAHATTFMWIGFSVSSDGSAGVRR